MGNDIILDKFFTFEDYSRYDAHTYLDNVFVVENGSIEIQVNNFDNKENIDKNFEYL